MRLIGEIEIFGKVRLATVELKDNKLRGVTKVGRRYKAYGYEGGKIKFYGYYNDEATAGRAARERRNLAREAKHGQPLGKDTSTGVTYSKGRWRVQLSIGGHRVSLGRYGSYGHAVLVRDVVARRTGKPAVVNDYEMPLGLVSDVVARSYITDIIRTVTAAEIAEYERRVAILNAIVT